MMIFICSAQNGVGQTFAVTLDGNNEGLSNSFYSVFPIDATDETICMESGLTEVGNVLRQYISLVKIDDLGSPISTAEFISDEGSSFFIGSSGGACQTSNGRVLNAGTVSTDTANYPAIFKFDEDCLVSELIIYETLLNWEGSAIIQTVDGFAMVGFIEESESGNAGVGLIKLDEDFQVEWYSTYHDSTFDLFGHSICTFDDGWAIGGTSVDPNSLGECTLGSWDTNGIIIKVDQTGDEDWRIDIGTCHMEADANLTSLSDGNLLVSMSLSDTVETIDNVYFMWPHALKIDLQGEIVWEKVYGDPSFQTTFQNATEISDGSLVFCGFRWEFGESAPHYHGMILKTNSAGDEIWSRIYNQEADLDCGLRDIISRSTGDFIAVGYNESSNDQRNSWVLRLDEFGCLTPGCHTGVEVDQENQVMLFPNPVNEALTVDGLELTGHSTYVIRDLKGGICLSGILLSNRIDVSALDAGIYFANFISGQRQFMIPVIKL